MRGRSEAGFALVPVILMLGMIGAIAFVMSLETNMTSRAADRAFEIRQAEYAAEAGYHHTRWRLQQITSCTGYAGLSDALSSSSYSTTVSPDNGSPIQLTATSVSGLDSTRQIQGEISTFSETNTIVLQPGSAGIDAFIWDGAHSDENFGASDILRLDSTGAEQAILIQFDLSGLANGAVIREANLELYAYSGTNEQNGEVQAHRITRSWVEGVEDDAKPNPGDGVTYDQYDGDQNWDNAGGDYQSTVAARTTIPNGNAGWHSWEITSSVRSWSSGALANNGLLLRVDSGDLNRREFASGDAADATLHPKLTIEYACACGTPCSAALVVADSIVVSNHAAGVIGGVPFQEVDLVEYNPGTDLGAIRLEGAVAGLSSPVDALHLLGDGSLILSTQKDDTLGSLSFSRDDLIRYYPATDIATTYFKSRLHFETAGASIDAVFVRPSGNLILSTEEGARIAGLEFRENDLIEFDPRTQEASLFLEGAAAGLEAAPSAIHLLDDGALVLALRIPTTFAGQALIPSDLVEYDPVLGSTRLYMDGPAAFGNENEAIQSLAILDGGSSSTPADPRLIAHWRLDETSGLIAEDSAGDHDGTLDSPDWTTAGQENGAADFDGSGDRIIVPHTDPLSLGGEFTLSTWIRPESISAFGAYRILSKESDGRNDSYFLALQGDQLVLGIDGSFFMPPNVILEDVWAHVAATFSDADDEVRIFVNGELALATSTTARLTPNTDPLYLGSSWEESKPWSGALDEIRIYNYALADAEIASLAAGAALSDGLGDDGGAGGDVGRSGGGSSDPLPGATGNYRDEFNAADSYEGSDGSFDWTSPWVEINESDGPSGGDERISDDNDRYELRIADNDSGGEGVSRAVNLSECNGSTFSFDYRRNSFDRSSDFVTVSASNDGGSSWKELQVIEGPGDDPDPITAKHDLTEFRSAETQIRFLTSSSLGGRDYLYIDNVEITCE